MIKAVFRRIFTNKLDATGLSVFRMAYTVVVFCEILQLFKYRHIIYDVVPFQYIGDIDPFYIFFFWFVILFMMFLGLFTRTALILNYILGVIIFGSASNFEYHVFHNYISINFVLMFMPVARVFSLDSLLQKVRYTNIGRPYAPDRTVLEVNYLIPVFVGIALVYFDSIFFKLTCRMWTDGLGVWLPSSYPQLVWSDTSLILNHEILVKFFGYLVLLFEVVFIFLFWFRKWRVPLFVLGVLFHVGIFITYPIPWFALLVTSVYLLMIPPGFWVRLSSIFKSSQPSFTFYYDADCPLCNKVVVMIRHFDVFNRIACRTVQAHAQDEVALAGIKEHDLLVNIYGVDQEGAVYIGYFAYLALLRKMIYTWPLALFLSLPGISHIGRKIYNYVAGHRLTERCTVENCPMPVFSAPLGEKQDVMVSGWNRLNLTQVFWKYVLIFMMIMQCIRILTSPAIEYFIAGTPVWPVVTKTNEIIRTPLKKFLGITSHPVFIYRYHLEGYNHIFKVVCQTNGQTVPLLDENGMVKNSYANGILWAFYTFRTNGKVLDRKNYETGLVRYLKYYQHEHGLPAARYKIYIKELDATTKWQKDFLHRQISKPWLPAGTCESNGFDFDFEWNAPTQQIFESEKK